jgi:ADP-ribose pyrophosphatase YjhB (NUDIX family)
MINYKFCPLCKFPLENLKDYLFCKKCDLRIYRNSKPTAGVLPVKDGKVLLARRAVEPFKGEIDVIGGFLNEGEHPERGALREAKEETGLDMKIKRLNGMYMDTYNDGFQTLNIHYIASLSKGKMKAQDDVLSLHWITIDKVPLNEGFKSTQESLRDLKKWYSKIKHGKY